MANVEQGKVAPILTASATLASGVATISSSAAAPINGSSAVQSIVRTALTATGTSGIPSARLDPPTAAAGVWSIKLTSSSATDAGTCSVYWVNEFVPSPNLVLGTTGTAGICQFAP